MKKSLPVSVMSLMLAASVLINGIHAKDAFNANMLSDTSQAASSKVAADLHPHIDKQMHKMTQDMPQLDGRSLRLRDYKRIQFNAWRNWLDSWRDQLALYLS